MSWFKPKNLLDETYEVGLFLKALDGVLEIVGAVLLAVISPQTINHLIGSLTQHELAEDPHAFIANHLLHAGQHLASGGTLYGVIYLAGHGAVKIVMVVALLRNKEWAYPFALITLGLFVLYQLYQISQRLSIGLILLSIFDVFIMWLIWREWHKQQPDHFEKKPNEAMDSAA